MVQCILHVLSFFFFFFFGDAVSIQLKFSIKGTKQKYKKLKLKYFLTNASNEEINFLFLHFWYRCITLIV